MKKLRVGLIGAGNIARAHLNGYRQCQDIAEVTAICDTSADAIRQRQQEFGITTETCADFEEMTARCELDAVDICLPIAAHEPATLSAVKAGMHVLVEKPLAGTLAEARRMVAAAEQAGMVLMVAHNVRFDPQYMEMRRILTAGTIGRVVSVRADINQYLARTWPATHWHYTHRGVLTAIGIHMVDTLRFLVEDIAGEIAKVSGFCATEMLPMQGADLGVAALKFSRGALGTLFASWCAVQHPWHDAIIIHGTQGALHNIGGLQLLRENGENVKIAGATEDFTDWRFRGCYGREIREFLSALRDRRQPVCNGRDNLKTMAAIEAVYQSAETGREVDVPSLLADQ